MSTMLAAEGEPCAAVVAFGYPLHPPGKPETLRVDHLSSVPVPTLYLSGTRDALAHAELMERHVVPLDHATVVWLEGADHSFRRRGTTPDAMLDLLVEHTVEWLEGGVGLGEGAPARP
jgi:uncharacterized protein